jgi:hypothetical protein
MLLDPDTLWCMLQAFRLTLTELDKSIDAGAQFFAALKSRTVLAGPTLEDYEQQLARLTQYRDQMREVVTRWGTMIEEFPTVEEPHPTSQAYTAIASGLPRRCPHL